MQELFHWYNYPEVVHEYTTRIQIYLDHVRRVIYIKL